MKTIPYVFAAILCSTAVYIQACEEKDKVEDVPLTLKEQVLQDPESVKKGEKTFNSLCVYCHGAGGSGGKAKKLAGRNLEVDYMFETITNGKKRGSLNMPPWRKLADEKRWQLVAYVKSLSDS